MSYLGQLVLNVVAIVFLAPVFTYGHLWVDPALLTVGAWVTGLGLLSMSVPRERALRQDEGNLYVRAVRRATRRFVAAKRASRQENRESGRPLIASPQHGD